MPPDGASVLLDTAPLIYVFEGNALAARFTRIFAAIDAGRLQAVVTPVTIAEVVAGPLKAGKTALAERYHALLCSWRVCVVDGELAMLAARLRARYRLRLPDAIQVAAAVHSGCSALVTHDRDFSAVDDLAIFTGD